MINQLKAQLKKFWKWLVALIMGGVVLAAGIALQPEEIPFIVVNGERIEFPYTDENEGEDLIIYTDKEIYTPLWAWNGFDVYVAVKNKSGKSQSISFQSFFSKDFSVEEVFVLNPTATTTIKEPVYKEICQEVATSTGATSTLCHQEKAGEYDKVVSGVWIPISQQEFSKEDYDKTISEKDIPVKSKTGTRVKGHFTDYSLKDQISYYKLRIKSNEIFQEEEFFLEIIGDEGSYGHLDPTVLTEDFNSYNDGDLNGQGGWTAASQFDIQGDDVYEGAKAVKATLASGNNVNASKTGTETADGSASIYVKVSNVSYNYLLFFLRTSTTDVYGIRFYLTNIQYKTGGSYVTFKSGAAADIWYNLQVEWRNSDYKARYRVDDGEWTDWFIGESSNSPSVVVLTAHAPGGAVNMFYDYIAEDPYPVPTVEPQMEVMIIE